MFFIVCEQILDERVILERVEGDFDLSGGATEIEALLNFPDRVSFVEKSVTAWLKQIGEV